MNEELRESIAEELEVDPAELVSDKMLNELENWDSVTALTIMIMIGDETGVPVMPNEIKELETFGDIEKLVQKKYKQAQEK